MSYKHPAWTKFFAARVELVDVLYKEGATDKQIANHISVSPEFVGMIRTLRGEPEPKKELEQNCRVRLLHNKLKCPIPAGTEGVFVRDSGLWALVQWTGLSEEEAHGIQWTTGLKRGGWVPLNTLEVL